MKINDFISYSDQRLYLPSIFNGQNVNWLLDCGAAVSCADVSLVRGKHLKAVPDGFHLGSASGHSIDVRGWIWTEITFGKRKCKVPLIICEGLKSQAILGIDFIKREGAVIDAKLDRVTIGNETIRTTSVKKAISANNPWGGKMNELRLTESIQILPMSGRVVSTQLRKPLEEETLGVCVDPTFLMEEGAQTVHEGKIRVTLHNPSLDVIEFKKGDTVGYFHPILEENMCAIDEIEKLEPKAEVTPKEKLKFMLENWRFGGPEKYKKRYWDLICKYQKVFSANKFDLGRSSAIRHKIHLKQSLSATATMRPR